jgi:hypothetical protein
MYDTTNGDILEAMRKGQDVEEVETGISGTINGDLLTGPTLAQAGDFIEFETALRKSIREVESVDGSDITLLDKIADEGSIDLTSFRVTRFSEASSYTNDERDAAVARVKTEVGHDNVAAVRFDADITIDKIQFFIDISDGNKLKKTEERISYE